MVCGWWWVVGGEGGWPRDAILYIDKCICVQCNAAQYYTILYYTILY